MSVKPILEAILFAAGHPMEYEKLAEVTECTVSEVKQYATEVCHCRDGAIAEMIKCLEKELEA